MRQVTPSRKIRVHVGWQRWWTELEDKKAAGWARRLGYVSRSKYYMEFPDSASQQIALDCEDSDTDWIVTLELYPGDSISQAKRFYEKVKVDALCGLDEFSWSISTNFHLAHIQKNMVYVKSSLTVRQYVEYWRENRGTIHQLSKPEFGRNIERWLSSGLISQSDIALIEKKFCNIQNATMNPCPGLGLRFTWPSNDVLKYESAGEFVLVVKRELSKAFLTWGQNCQEFWP